MPALSAVDSVSPALRHTIQQMFKPFRFGFWWRIALLGFFTAEISGSGGFNGGNIPSPSRGGAHPRTPFPFHLPWFTPDHIIKLAIVFILFVFVFSLLITYVGAVMRFMLFDAVVLGDARIRAGWIRRQRDGQQYFLFQLILFLLGWGLLVLCIFVPLMSLFGNHHIGFWFIDAKAVVTLVLGMVALAICSFMLLILTVLAKDFVVPIMALEHIGWQEAFRRFFAIAEGHASEYVLYFLMKIVLRIAAGIGHGIVMFALGVIIAIPVAIAVIAGVAMGAGATAVVKATLITLAIVGGLLVLGIFIALSALTGAPIAYFFPSYAVYFFAGRYGELGQIVFPAAPLPVAPAAPVIPEPPPIPA